MSERGDGQRPGGHDPADQDTPKPVETGPGNIQQNFQDPGEDSGKIDDPGPTWLPGWVARRQTYRRRRKPSNRPSASFWLGAVLVGLTAINVYVFFVKDDTAVSNLRGGRGAKESARDAAKTAAKLAMVPGGVPEPTVGPADGKSAKSPMGTPAGEGLVAAPEPQTKEGSIGDNESLWAVVEREGFGAATPAVLRALSRLHDPRSIRPGDGYAVTFNGEGAPIAFEYRPSPILRYVITAGANGVWLGEKQEKPLTVRAETTGATIDSSLYESVAKAGEGAALASQLVELFAWDINFYTDTHPGDRWRMVVEKQYLDGKFYRYGNILAAEYGGRAGTYRAFAWSSATGHGPVRYFNERGEAITKSFLKTPLRFVRVSSKFDRNRFHPVLHRNKAHLGVDYAAPTGTPIWASASGRVVEVAHKPGSGKTVVIEHGNGLATRYYHLSRFAAGMRAGRQVRQKEIIGYVGTTGLSTGPHLHFALTRNGVFVDPLKMQAVREAPVGDKVAFQAAIKPHLQAMAGLRIGVPAAAASVASKK